MSPRFLEFPVKAMYCNKVLTSEDEFFARFAYSNYRDSSNVFDVLLFGEGSGGSLTPDMVDLLPKLRKLSAS